jgi:hypothetical protein
VTYFVRNGEAPSARAFAGLTGVQPDLALAWQKHT